MTGILLFLKGLVSGAFSLVGSLFKAAVEHPKATAIIIGLLVLVGATAWWTNKWAVERTRAEYAAIMEEYQKKFLAYEAKARQVEFDTKEAALALEATKAENARMITEVSSFYEDKLAAEVAKRKVTTRYVTVPGSVGSVQVPVMVDENTEEVVCRRLPDAFLDTWNGMIQKANAVGETK